MLENVDAIGEPPEEIVLAGFLLRGGPGTLRVVSGHLCLELAEEDVLGVEEQPLPEGLDAGLAIPVELRLRRGARLLDVTASDMYEPLLVKAREPFALAVRETAAPMQEAPRFRELETAFRELHGLQ